MKILVLGCGSIGSRHTRNASALAQVAVVDAQVERAEPLVRELDAKFFLSLEQALDWRPDAAVIATPHTTHVELASRLVQAGVPVLIEKPIADSLSGIDDMLATASRGNVPVFVVCNMRFHPGVATLRQHLASIGKPYFARASYGNYLPDMRPNADYRSLYCARKASGGGVILDAIHEIDYLTWLFGDTVGISAAAGRLSDLDIDVEDYAAINLHHSGGVRSEIHLDYLQRFKRRSCEIVGANGTLIWSSEGKNPEVCSVRWYNCEQKAWHVLYESKQIDTNQPYVELMKAFVESVKGTPHPSLLTGAQAKRTLETALAVKAASGNI